MDCLLEACSLVTGQFVLNVQLCVCQCVWNGSAPSGLLGTPPCYQRVGGVSEGAGRLLPHSLQFWWKPSSSPEVPHAHRGCAHTHEHHHHHHQRSPGCRWTHVHTPPRSITQTPMMRGCSSRPKPTQNQDRSGKTRRSERFGTLARLYIVHLWAEDRERRAQREAGRAALQDVNKSRCVGAVTETFTPHTNHRRQTPILTGSRLIVTAADVQ